jgi:hypothetical protein
VAVRTFVLAPQGELAVEVHRGGLIEEVAEAVFSIWLPILK